MKKTWAEILKSPIFDLKKSLIKIAIQISNKIRGFCYEKVEKKSIL
jgi:hypothetical protein